MEEVSQLKDVGRLNLVGAKDGVGDVADYTVASPVDTAPSITPPPPPKTAPVPSSRSEWYVHDLSKEKGLTTIVVSPFISFGTPPGNRTPNLLIKSQLLCQLS